MKGFRSYLLFIFCCTLLVGCSKPQDDQAMIQAQIEELQEAIENHDSSQFMDAVADNYSDKINKDRISLQRLLIVYFLRYKAINVFASAHEFEITPRSAIVNSQVVLTGGAGLIPENARHYQVESCWKKESDEWLLSCLKWQ